MIFINNITLKQKYRTLSENLSIDLGDVTLLVGEQGCGKSTLLKLLSKNSDKLKFDLTKYARINRVASFYFDTETMNPRVIDPIANYTTPSGQSKGIGVGNGYATRYKSHGEVLREITVNSLHKANNSVILLDEPESGLSLKNQYRLCEELKKACDSNQIVIATHSLVLIESFEKVYDLENKNWIPSFDFIRNNKL